MTPSPISLPSRIAAPLLFVFLLGMGCLTFFAYTARERDLARSTQQLNAAADTAASRLAVWSSDQFTALSALSKNPALQIYFMDITAASATAQPPAQADYLRAQLNMAAERLGYAPAEPTLNQRLSANVEALTSGGIAVVDRRGKTVMASGTMPPIDATLAEIIAAAPGTEGVMRSLPVMPSTGPRALFILPIYRIQAEATAEARIGSLVALRPLNASFFQMLASSLPAKSAELSLVEAEGNQLRRLTDAGMVARVEHNNTGESADAFAAAQPGQSAMRVDDAGNDVLVTGRAIVNTPWTLIATLDRREIFTESNGWLRAAAAFSLILTLLIGAIIYSIAKSADARATQITLQGEQEIANTTRERGKRLHTLQQLIATLISLVDRRDPNAAQHSNAAALLAANVARELGLDAATVETAETAARLLNLGKMDVPAELLTRRAGLNMEEKNTIRSSLAQTADLVEGIEFEGPVAETLRQAQEYVDGSGPLGLKGEEILISARIVAAANAAIGMCSPRAYRSPMTLQQAIGILNQNSGMQFDSKVVGALLYYLENRGGKEAIPLLLTPARKQA